jgi:hypothetical protein
MFSKGNRILGRSNRWGKIEKILLPFVEIILKPETITVKNETSA